MIKHQTIEGQNRLPKGHQITHENRQVSPVRFHHRSAHQNRSQDIRKDDTIVLRSQTSTPLSVSSNGYRPLSRSDVSDPDNLVCDNCVNQKIHANKLKVIAQERKRDKEEVNRVNQSLLLQFEEEKRKHLEKLRLYQEAVRLQNEVLMQKNQLEKEKISKEREMTRSALAEVDHDNRVKKDIERQKNAKYYAELKDQIQMERERKAKSDGEMLEKDRKTKNLIVDDTQQKHMKNKLNQEYRAALTRQIEDNKATKIQERSQEQLIDKMRNQHLEAIQASNERLREKLNAEKRKIFFEELTTQLNEKKRLTELEKQAQARENKDYLNILERNDLTQRERDRSQKLIQKEYAHQISEQISQNRMRLQQEKEEARQPYLTSLPMGVKVQKTLPCKICHHTYPLKMLNRPRKIIR